MTAATHRILAVAVIGAGVLTAGCGYPFGPCYSEHIEVGQTATLDRGAGAVEWDGAGVVAPGNIPDFDLLRDYLIDGRALAGRQVVWTVNTSTGYLAVFMPATLRSGDEVEVSAIVGGGWGVASGSGAQVSLLDGEFQATSATGTITILETQPLRVRLEVTATEADGASRTLSAAMSFSHSRVRTNCT